MQPHTGLSSTDKPNNEFLAILKSRLDQKRFRDWFAGEKTSVTIENDLVILGVASPFLLKWMQREFKEICTQVAQEIVGPSARLRFDVDTTLVEKTRPNQSDSETTNSQNVVTGKTAIAPTARPATSVASSTNQKRRFADISTFVTGSSNELAITAAQQICLSPGVLYNPLYLHGTVGNGKTHLLEGIYRRISRQFPSLRVVFLTAEGFANYFTQALREKSLPSFRQRFRNVDVLIMDDIEFFDGKRSFQEEFLHTFKHLESCDCQMIFAGDRHPRLLTKFSDELTTRLLSGLVCRIESPDLETRVEICHRKANLLKLNISDSALEDIAKRFPHNVRELEGALNCLMTHQAISDRRISVKSARMVLSQLERDCVRIVRVADIEEAVCEMFGLESEDLQSSKRSRSISRPRMLAMYLTRKLTQAAYKEIGQHFGGRNHTTVLSAEKKVNSWIDEHETLRIANKEWPLKEIVTMLEQRLQVG